MIARVFVFAFAAGVVAAAAPASADLPDFAVTPFECAGFDAETNSCASLSSPTFTTPDSGTATTRAIFAVNPAFFGITSVDDTVLVEVAVTSDFTIGPDDVFCSDYEAAEIVVTPVEEGVAENVITVFAMTFTNAFRSSGVQCAAYTREGEQWVFHIVDNGAPVAETREEITMLDAAAGASVVLRPRSLTGE